MSPVALAPPEVAQSTRFSDGVEQKHVASGAIVGGSGAGLSHRSFHYQPQGENHLFEVFRSHVEAVDKTVNVITIAPKDAISSVIDSLYCWRNSSLFGELYGPILVKF